MSPLLGQSARSGSSDWGAGHGKPGYLNEPAFADVDLDLLRLEVLLAVAIGEELQPLVCARPKRKRARPAGNVSSEYCEIEM